MTRLITIPFSHYCEKARWALDRCGVEYEEEGYLPLVHYLGVRRLRSPRSVPVLVDGSVAVRDSTDIVAWADARRPGTLLPSDGTRATSLALEDSFDRDLGPAARRWAYLHLLPRGDLDAIVTRGLPTWQVRWFPVLRPLLVPLLKRGLNITPAGAERSSRKVDETFAAVAELLRDGRRYLCGDRFTVADLTFASLASPVLLPAEHPFELPRPEDFQGEARDRIEGWRASPAGRFALRLYREDR